jgi:hypothetical protein
MTMSFLVPDGVYASEVQAVQFVQVTQHGTAFSTGTPQVAVGQKPLHGDYAVLK